MNDLVRIAPGRLHLLISSRRDGRRLMNALAARLALEGPLQVLDGGNSLDVYTIARIARQQAARPEAVLQRVHIARAFTCYQMSSLLAEHCDRPIPTLVLDVLATFYDENVRLEERRRLLELGLAALRRLSRQVPVAVSASPVEATQPIELLRRLAAVADQCWHASAPVIPTQGRLF
jgi:hypothetical protein